MVERYGALDQRQRLHERRTVLDHAARGDEVRLEVATALRVVQTIVADAVSTRARVQDAPVSGERRAAMNGAESLVRTLVGGGVEVCFANPGVFGSVEICSKRFCFNVWVQLRKTNGRCGH